MKSRSGYVVFDCEMEIEDENGYEKTLFLEVEGRYMYAPAKTSGPPDSYDPGYAEAVIERVTVMDDEGDREFSPEEIRQHSKFLEDALFQSEGLY